MPSIFLSIYGLPYDRQGMLDCCKSDDNYQLQQSDGYLTNIDSMITDRMEWQAMYYKNKSGYIKIADDLSVF